LFAMPLTRTASRSRSWATPWSRCRISASTLMSDRANHRSALLNLRLTG